MADDNDDPTTSSRGQRSPVGRAREPAIHVHVHVHEDEALRDEHEGDRDDPSQGSKRGFSDDKGSDRNGERGGKRDREKKDDKSGSDGDAGSDDDDDDEENDDDDDDEGEDGDKDKTPLYRKPKFWIIAGTAFVVIAVVGMLWWLHARKYEDTDDAFVDTHLVRIAPQVAGQLVHVADIDNRHVKKGQLLAVIEPTGPEAQLDEARAGLAQAEAQVSEARTKVVQAEAARAQAQAKARQPEAQARQAAGDLARYRELARIDADAVSASQVDGARAQAQATEATAEAARRDIATATADIIAAQSAVEGARAQVSARRAQVDQAKVTIGNLRLTAPIDGQAVNRQVNIGSYVAPGTQIMVIVPDRIWVTANFKETQLALMRMGQPVEITVDAFPDVEFHGHIDSFQRGAGQAFALLPAQNATGNYVKVVQRVPVRIVFDRGPDGKAADWRRWPLGPGMSVVPTVQVR